MFDKYIRRFFGSLHRAARDGDVRRVRGYIDDGADVNAPDRKGSTPLEYAAARGSLESVELLLERGAAARYVNPGGGTALHSALLHRHTDVALLLIDGGADISRATAAGVTPLHLAAHFDLVPAVGRLLRDGADIEARSAQNQTPLFLAVTGMMAVGTEGRCIRLLLDAGADPRPGPDPGDDYVGHILGNLPARAVLFREFKSFVKRCQDAAVREYVCGELARLRKS